MTTVAIVVHHGDQRRTVRAVMRHHDLNLFSRITVVANDLSMRPAELTEDICAWLIPRRNLGFAAACQFAADKFPADVYAFFNAHVTIDGVSVRRCVAAFDIPDVGIAAPNVHLPAWNPDKDWEYTCCIRTYSRILRRPIRVPIRQLRVGEVIDNEWATGCAIFCRHEIIRDIGWDGSYFLTYEDADISIRARRNGWRVVSVPSALAFHTGESTRPRAMSAYYGARNPIWFYRKYWSRPRQILLTLYLIVLLFRLAAADELHRRKPRHAPSAARGIVDGWALWPLSKDPLPGEPLRFPQAHPQGPFV